MAHKKFTVSLPDHLVVDLDYVSGRMSISRSALISSLLQGPVRDMRTLFEGLPENPTEEEILRSRGASIDLIQQRMESMRRLESDLFSK